MKKKKTVKTIDLKDLDFDKNNSFHDWEYFSSVQFLSEDFIREYQYKVDWGLISQYQILSEDFIREFKDRVDWFFISLKQELSEYFIDEFFNSVNWKAISLSQKMSTEFILRNSKLIDVNCLKNNKKINKKEIESRGIYSYIKLSQ